MEVSDHLGNGFYLALIYLVIAGNYIGNLFGCRVQQLFKETMWIKHLLGLFTTYFLIILASPPAEYSTRETLVFTTAIYGWFFLTTKMHVRFWIPMILAVLAAYFVHVYTKQQTDKGEPKPAEEPTQAILKRFQQVAVAFAAVMTVVGVVVYYGEKKIEYGSVFSTWTFWNGVSDCKFDSPTATISESVVAAFSG
jgi:hypothetical protein